MPLAAGYLGAMAQATERLSEQIELELVSFKGGRSSAEMAELLFGDAVPDLIALSICGWNFFQFGAVSETYRQLNPRGWVIWGGTHVANQAHRVFRLFPWVDVVANGEGEYVFRDILEAHLTGRPVHDLGVIAGISYQNRDGQCVTTAPRPRIAHLDDIPSPFLSGFLPLADARGRFRYDVALMETSRGCPYKCAFCYWGGAIGQKIRAFSRERLRAEADMFARVKVETLVLCDANFGLRREDEQFVDDLIELKRKYGYPRTLETSWAKNKSRTFFRIVEKMKAAELHSSFTLALQTMSDVALSDMHRLNMKLNDWESLAAWLDEQGLNCYAELIWGAPGDTPQTFLDGYDHLAQWVPRIATYPLLLLPNTDYFERRNEHRFVTVRGRSDDFEYVLANKTMTIKDNQRMQGFLFWARIAAENPTFRHIWPALLRFAHLRQSVVLQSLATWFDHCERAEVGGLRTSDIHFGNPAVVPQALQTLCTRPALDELLDAWWSDQVVPRLPDKSSDFLTEVFRYDVVTRPLFERNAYSASRDTCTAANGEAVYISDPIAFNYHPSDLTISHRSVPVSVPTPHPCDVIFQHRVGYSEHLANHEMAIKFVGTPFDVSDAPSRRVQRQRPLRRHAPISHISGNFTEM